MQPSRHSKLMEEPRSEACILESVASESEGRE